MSGVHILVPAKQHINYIYVWGDIMFIEPASGVTTLFTAVTDVSLAAVL